jgi:chemotaxis signal transduction protein
VQQPEVPTAPVETRDVLPEATVGASALRAAGSDTEGYVLFAVGATSFAVAVSEVREVVRAARLDLLPDLRQPFGRGVALVDARGRAIPVIDLRGPTDAPGDVLLPVYRHQVGLVVDRVLSVRTPLELVPEHEHVPDALPTYARGVLRPADGGDPVLLVKLPDAAELQADGRRGDGARLGADLLGGRREDDAAPADGSG